jgi:hypothetical protein
MTKSNLTNKAIPSQLENMKLNRRPLDPSYFMCYKKQTESVKDKSKDIIKSQNFLLGENSQISVKSQIVPNLQSQLSLCNDNYQWDKKLTLSVSKINPSQVAKSKNNKRNKKSKNKIAKTKKKKNPSELIDIEEDEHDVQFDDSDKESQIQIVKAPPRNPQLRSHLQYLIQNNLLKKTPVSDKIPLIHDIPVALKSHKVFSQACSDNTQTNIEQVCVNILQVLNKDENNGKFLVKVEGYEGENIISIPSSYYKYFNSDFLGSYYLRIRRCGSHDPNSSTPPRIHFNCFGIAK